MNDGIDAYPDLAQLDLAAESLKKIRPELEPLLLEHWKEFHGYAPKFNWPLYEKYEEAGVTRCYTARDRGVLVGYLVLFVMPYIHETDSTIGFVDVFWMRKEHRGGGEGARLFEFMHVLTRAEGVRRWRAGYRLTKDLSGFYEKLGYVPIELHCEKFAREATCSA